MYFYGKPPARTYSYHEPHKGRPTYIGGTQEHLEKKLYPWKFAVYSLPVVGAPLLLLVPALPEVEENPVYV